MDPKRRFCAKITIDRFLDNHQGEKLGVKISTSRTHGNNKYKGKNVKSNLSSLERHKTARKNASNPTKGKKNLSSQVQVLSKSKSQPQNQDFWSLFMGSVFRLGIVGVGLGTIVGTIFANLDLTKPIFPNLNFPLLQTEKREKATTVSSETKIDEVQKVFSPSTKNSSVSYTWNRKLISLEEKLTNLQQKYPQLEPGALFVDLDNGAYADFNGTTTFSAASTIKIPILVAFFQDVDAGKVYLDEQLTMDQEVIAPHAGNMQYSPVGTKFTALATATQMIVISDNTATNMLIRRLGGVEALNQRFQEWGLESTVIRNFLPDLKGTNTTSPKDLAYLLAKVNSGDFLSLRSRDRILHIMEQTKTNTLLPQGLEQEALIAHKTGDIGTVLGDAGIIDIPTGKRYIAAVLVKREHNDNKARTLIQEISRTSYQHLKNYLPRPSLAEN